MEEEFLQRVMCSIPIGQVECDRYVEKVLSNKLVQNMATLAEFSTNIREASISMKRTAHFKKLAKERR